MDLSIIIPTYNERLNLPIIVKKISDIYKLNGISGEIIIVDDGSPDGSGDIADILKKKLDNLKVIHRSGKLGLSSAVLEGFSAAEGNFLGVMDADLSHPPETIPNLYGAVLNGADIAIGSRYIRGGGIIGWRLTRHLFSRAAIFGARPFTLVKDPMSGFFVLNRKCIENISLNSKGFKILLEILVKGRYAKVNEIPIIFRDRKYGKTKAGIKEVAFYIWNLLGYVPYKLLGRKE